LGWEGISGFSQTVPCEAGLRRCDFVSVGNEPCVFDFLVTIQLIITKEPPAALPGAKLLKSLINRSSKLFLNEFRLKGGCDLTRGTRGKAHSQSAFEVAHLAAGGFFSA